ncbi:glycosyltransferase 87 family protein [Kitasatospora sp. GAS1066B]|uniref:glycosyltransferase 87 family protein n=1 Tax=Kitasatospora sp. GAS1066B TaxID=3156271 RepID=UPI003515E0E9
MPISALPQPTWARGPRPESAGGSARGRHRRGGERRGRVLGGGALLASALCVVLAVAAGLLGPSAVEPVFGRRVGDLPPWFVQGNPSDLLVWLLVAAVLGLGTVTVVAGLLAVRRGWAPRPRLLLAGGAVAVLALLCVPPAGTTDPLNYAAYGRIETLGLNPYQLTPAGLAQTGDPVGKLALAEPWLHTPSVYGPLATVSEWAASLLGGASMLRTVWLLSVLGGAAFLATGALLLRLAGPDPARRVRSQLLWTLNPVLWWNLVVGPHVDTLCALCVVVGFWALRRSGIAAALAIAAGAAIKLTAGVFALPLAWHLRHDRRRLALAATAGAVALAAGYAFTPRAVHNAQAVSNQAADGTPWELLQRSVLVPVFGAARADQATTVLELIAAVVLAGLLLAALDPAEGTDPARLAARPALAVVLAYLLGTAYVRPWYDALAWVLVAMLARSWLDWVLLAHTVLLTLVYDPGLAHMLHPAWLYRLVLQIAYRLVPDAQLLLVAVVVVGCGWRILRRRRAAKAAGGRQPAAPGAAGAAG